MASYPVPPTQVSLDAALTALAAAGEETRLRILALIAQTELAVSELGRACAFSR